MRILFGNATPGSSLSRTGFLIALVLTTGAMGQSIPSKLVTYPELILHNGKVLTVDDRFSIVQAVAIRDGRFLEVGTNQEVLALKGPATQVIDVQGRTVIPGFVDAHGHGGWVSGGSRDSVSGSSLQCEELDECLERLRATVAKARPGQWIRIGGLRNNILVNQITRWDLDKVSPNNPVRISLDTAMSIVNTPGWEIYRTRIEGMPGVFKDPNTGQPNGHIRGQANGALTYDFEEWPPDWETRLVEEQIEKFRAMNSEGVTTNIGRMKGVGMAVLTKLWQEGRLTVRARPCSEVVMYNPEAESYLKRLGNISGLGDDWFTIIGVTVGPPDGTVTTGGVLTRLDKKHDINLPGGPAWDMKGENKWAFSRTDGKWDGEKTEFESIVLANRYGWSVQCLHSQGDFGAKMILDAYEKANQERPIKGRHFAFDHGLIRTEEDMQRAVRLGVHMSFASKYVFTQTLAVVWQFGEDTHGLTPVKAALDLGLKPAIELDDVREEGEQSSSLANMENFITRTDNTGRVWGSREGISRQDALRMGTIWSAAYSGDDKRLGSIAEGKLGDLVVLGGDYLEVPADKIGELPIDLTIVGGKIVYDRARDGFITSRRSRIEQ